MHFVAISKEDKFSPNERAQYSVRVRVYFKFNLPGVI